MNIYSETPPTKAPNIAFSILLATLLLFPFSLKLMLTEPYPAVIMPSGSGSIDLSQNSYSFVDYRVFGVRNNGHQEPINILQLITPAQPQYLYAIFENDFGLASDPVKELKLRGTDWTLLRYRQRGATEKQRAECRVWLNARLDQRYKELILQKVTVTGDLNTRIWTNETVDKTTLIAL